MAKVAAPPPSTEELRRSIANQEMRAVAPTTVITTPEGS